MAETEAPQQQTQQTPKPLHGGSVSIWPPAQRTRDAVTSRLIETLSSTSLLSKRYGTVPKDEAADLAKRIEEEAFAAASSSASVDDDGIEILQVYSKEISKRMLDSVKSRSDSVATTPAADAASSTPVVKEDVEEEEEEEEAKKVKEESSLEEAAAGDAAKSEE